MKLRSTRRALKRVAPAVGLLLLSALWAIGWLRSDLIPSASADTLAPAQSQAVLLSVFAILAASIALAKGAEFPRGRRAWAFAGIGVGLFVIPAALTACAQGWVSSLDRVVVFSLTPVFAVVLEPYLHGGAPQPGRRALAGALAAVAGILFVFPLDIPGSFRATAGLCAMVAAAIAIAVANCFAVRLACNLAGRSILPMAAQAGAASAICFVVAAVFRHHAAWRWSAPPGQLFELLLMDLPALFLLFWLLPRLAASRMAARFLLAPLFALVAGMVLEPTTPPARAWLGLALLTGGAGWLVFAPPEEPETEKPASLLGVIIPGPQGPEPTEISGQRNQ